MTVGSGRTYKDVADAQKSYYDALHALERIREIPEIIRA